MVEGVCGFISSFLQFREREREKDEILTEKRSLSPSEGLLFTFLLQVRLLFKAFLQVRVLRP